jgi:hypothetical protein
MINWNEVQKAISPVKDYESLCQRWQGSFSYPFVRETFNYSLQQLADYTLMGVGGDPKGRYKDYAARLLKTISALEGAGVQNIFDLGKKTQPRSSMETFIDRSGMQAVEIAQLEAYLVYWFIPMKNPLPSLARNDEHIMSTIKNLQQVGIKSNLDLLQAGRTSADRTQLAQKHALSLDLVTEVVNRADLSRLPWTSKATISNIVCSGYGSLSQLAGADSETLYADYMRYGEKIGKNLRIGNEIENSQRFARIVPTILQE